MAPVDLLETIVEYRAFADAKGYVDRAKTKADIPDTPMCRLVQELEFEEAQAELDAHRAQTHGESADD